ncbi:Asp-tRNA(Asn)/Glu-tRNA(Gln) amidotransferase subunit GatC [Candidatus Woesearchaeota archaeon]|nr:Asp-tRNA(Asn)/Glu-tRNA(Gln) amidotransferase subunit GatC [Candidatus Woesearchaeota archaeon]
MVTSLQKNSEDKQEKPEQQKTEAKADAKDNKANASAADASAEINKELIKHVAALARLKLTEKELEKFVPELKEIINTFSQLNKVNVDNVEPSFQPVELKNALRDDIVEKSFTNEEALSNAEHKKEGYFKGPSVM